MFAFNMQPHAHELFETVSTNYYIADMSGHTVVVPTLQMKQILNSFAVRTI